MAVESYYDVTGDQHQAHYERLYAAGYRLISISVYGSAYDPRYAAVWVQRSGPQWRGVHGVSEFAYRTLVDQWGGEGYVPVLVSATGTVSSFPPDTVFAGVFERGIAGNWYVYTRLTEGPTTDPWAFRNQNTAAHTLGMILRSATIYGTEDDPRYAAIWHQNWVQTKWQVSSFETEASHKAAFDAATQLPGVALAGYRASIVTLSDYHRYCSCFSDDFVGKWTARHGLTASGYEEERQQQAAHGRYPISLQGGGAGPWTRFAAVFAEQDLPVTRTWRVTGGALPQLAGLDSVIGSFMMRHGVRAAQLAVARNGDLRMSRGYTWAEPTYRTIQPSDRFLLASCSKMFLAAMVQWLYDDDRLAPTTLVYPQFGFSGPFDLRSDEITVEQLLEHEGGFDKDKAFYDPTYSMGQIARDLGLSEPATKMDVARHMYKDRALEFDPGTDTKYSNYGYVLLSALIEHIMGQDYVSLLHVFVLAPEGIHGVAVSSTEASRRLVNQAITEDGHLGLNPLTPYSQAMVPAVYGGDQQIKEVADGSAGLACPAEDMARFLGRHAVWGHGGRALGSRSGGTPGASTFACSRWDGVDWALTLNTREWADEEQSYLALIGNDEQVGSINYHLARTTVP